MNREYVLVADDEDIVLDFIFDTLSEEGYVVDKASDGREASLLLREKPYDIFLTDIRMPEKDGVTLIKEARELYPDIISIVLTGFPTIELAVECIREGAYDFLQKPLQPMKLKITLANALERKRLERENLRLTSQLRDEFRFENIIGETEVMTNVFENVKRVAKTDTSVLIHGHSGTGKELIAKAIHYNSHRKDMPLICINCGAIPSTLLEDELFGHVKGAFTDAYRDKPGRFEQADGGTLFLDEVGNMSHSLQVRLLRVLQERRFERIGGTKTIKVDVRIIAATNTSLEEKIKDGSFREDLYYRLNVFPLYLPLLVERKDDIKLLANYFVKKNCEKMNKQTKKLSQKALQSLLSYNWPGNVRELENIIERAVILSEYSPVINPEDLNLPSSSPSSSIPLKKIEIPEEGVCLNTIVSNIEKELILQSLKKTSGNKKRAAALLGLKRTTLIQKIKRRNIILEPAFQPPS